MARKTMRRIGPIGTASRVLAGFALLYLALSDGGRLSWDLRWHEVALGLGVLPAVLLGVGLAASRFGSGPVRFTGPLALASARPGPSRGRSDQRNHERRRR